MFFFEIIRKMSFLLKRSIKKTPKYVSFYKRQMHALKPIINRNEKNPPNCFDYKCYFLRLFKKLTQT